MTAAGQKEALHTGSLDILEKERMNLTSIMLKVNGVEVSATVTGTLTSGMVGIPVTIQYDQEWEGLNKNLVCRCGRGEPDSDEEQRAILNVGEAAAVAHGLT